MTPRYRFTEVNVNLCWYVLHLHAIDMMGDYSNPYRLGVEIILCENELLFRKDVI